MQELIRKVILESLEIAKQSPETSFYTMIPEKTWDGYKTVEELKEYAKALGGKMANGIEQGLEWAQRISNGESWETICNSADTAKYYRMIFDGKEYLIVGGSHINNDDSPAASLNSLNISSEDKVNGVVPLVAFYNMMVC